MQTKYLYYPNDSSIEEASRLIQNGEVVAFPTETVYGLGADATNKQAVNKIFHAKGRPSDNPLIVHIAQPTQMKELVMDYPNYVTKLMTAFSPGPITYVLKSTGVVTENVTAGLDTVGIRIPNHPAAQALLQATNLPLAAPSANLSGKPSPTSASHVKEDMNGKIAAILDGGPADIGLESTVLDCTGRYPVILRHGGISQAEIEQIIQVQKQEKNDTAQPKSPGTKYTHYTPEVPLILVQDVLQLQTFIDEERRQGKMVGALVTNETAKGITADKIFNYGHNEQELARHLYDNLRMMRKKDVDIVFAEKVTTETLGQAVVDRLIRASSDIV